MEEEEIETSPTPEESGGARRPPGPELADCDPCAVWRAWAVRFSGGHAGLRIQGWLDNFGHLYEGPAYSLPRWNQLSRLMYVDNQLMGSAEM